jgi:SAM-dependent methyltransferase
MTAGARRCIVCDRSEPFTPVFAQGEHRLVRCPGCRLVFQHPQPPPDVLAGAYYHDPGFTVALFGELREVTLQRAREKVDPLERAGALRAGGRALDVGCSSGAWLEVAAEHGMKAVGVELGEATASAARERGLDVRTGTLEQALPGLSGASFDLVTFWDVLEHLPDPRHELAIAAVLLAPGGVVAASFPNVEGWYPRLTYRLLARRTGVWEYPELPVHLYDFSPSTARALFARGGFGRQTLETSATPFAFYRETSLSPERLGSGRRGRALRLAFEALRVPVYPLARLAGRGNAMFVAARKDEQQR